LHTLGSPISELNEATLPTELKELDGHTGGTVRHVVSLPDKGLIATSGDDGIIRIFRAESGALLHELVSASAQTCPLAALSEDVLLSSGSKREEVLTWRASTGEKLGRLVVARSIEIIYCLAAQGRGRFVVGVKDGSFVFCTHEEGHQVKEFFRMDGVDWYRVYDLATHGLRLVSAHWNSTARVWDTDSKKAVAVLEGHQDLVSRVCVNDEYIVTASFDTTLRVYSSVDFQCLRSMRDVHTARVRSLNFLHCDLVLSSGMDRNVCVTDVSTGIVLARIEIPFAVYSVAVLQDGRLVVSGMDRRAAVVTCPRVQSLLENSLFGGDSGHSDEVNGEMESALTVVLELAFAAGDACRSFLSRRTAPRTFLEWVAAHDMFMIATRDGDAHGPTATFDLSQWWETTLYDYLGNIEVDCVQIECVQRCLDQVELAGIVSNIGSLREALVARARPGLFDTPPVDNLQRAIERAIESAASSREKGENLSDLLKRYKAGQKVSTLVSAFLRIVSCMALYLTPKEILSVLEIQPESINIAPLECYSIVTRALWKACALLRNNCVLSMDQAGRGFLNTTILRGGFASLESLREVYRNALNNSGLYLIEPSPASTRLESSVLSERYDEREKRESEHSEHHVWSHGPASKSIEMLGEHSERQIGHSDPSLANLGDSSENVVYSPSMSSAFPACGSYYSVGAESNNNGPSQELVFIRRRIRRLGSREISRSIVSDLTTEELAAEMTACMLGYEESLAGSFVQLHQVLFKVLSRQGVRGNTLIGSITTCAAFFYNSLVAGLGANSPDLDVIGYRVALLRFMAVIGIVRHRSATTSGLLCICCDVQVKA
jgi:WD domain, G-beta repeat